MSEIQNGSFKGHAACVLCDSSDAMAVYEKIDEEGQEYLDGYCYACESYIQPSKLGYDIKFSDYSKEGSMAKKLDMSEIEELDVRGVKERKLERAYTSMYGMKVGYDTETGEIDSHYYPVTRDGVITGYKVRELPKKFKAIGDTKKSQLFGQWLFDEGGPLSSKVSKKFLVITEGELDCIAMQQALSKSGDSRYTNAVVSLPNGANEKAIKENWKFVTQFEKVILVFDSDEPGMKAAQDVAKRLPMGKTSIATLPLKDPCEMVSKGRSKELAKCLWDAKPFSPAGIVAAKDLWEQVSEPLKEPDADFPWKGVNEKLRGLMSGQIYTLAAGSGVAKTTFAKDIMHHVFNTTDFNIGGIFIEEKPKKTLRTFMGAFLKKIVHLAGAEVSKDELKEAFEATAGTDRVFFYDSFGSNTLDQIKETILYYALALDCKLIILDHISMMVSGGSADERKELDKIMTVLATLVEELDITLILVSHLSRPEGKSHEEGGQTSLNQLRGSGGIGQLSHNVLGIERNGQADSDFEKNVSTIRVLKCRDTGDLGIACRVFYDKSTGELKELDENGMVEGVDNLLDDWDGEVKGEDFEY